MVWKDVQLDMQGCGMPILSGQTCCLDLQVIALSKEEMRKKSVHVVVKACPALLLGCSTQGQHMTYHKHGRKYSILVI